MIHRIESSTAMRNLSAMRHSDRDAEQILKTANDALRQKIICLFVEQRLTPHAIMQLLEREGQISISDHAHEQTKAGVLRRVVRELVDDTLRTRIINDRYAQHLQSVSDLSTQCRGEWMRQHGMHVWSDEEEEYFDQLINDPNNRRSRTRLNHSTISQAMIARFQNKYFSPKNCMGHLLYLRHKDRALERQREKRNAKKNGNGSGE